MNSDTVDMAMILVGITGVAWTIVYINAIWVGFRQKTFAMPLVALALNFAWELTYSAVDLRTAVTVPTAINTAWALVEIVWALFDVVVIYTFFRFGRAEFPSLPSRRVFVGSAILAFAVSGAMQWLFIAEFGATVAVRYSAFLQTVVMSWTFIAMFVARQGLRGQTLTIAIGKWIGTLAATILYGVVERSSFVLGLGIVCCVLDLVYIGLVVWAKRRPDVFATSRMMPDAARLPDRVSGIRAAP
jgi:hypothetical protein